MMLSVEQCMQQIEDLSTSRLSLPFRLPDTPAAQQWFFELEFADVIEGSIEQLKRIATTAPTEKARRWVLKQVARRLQ